MVNLTCVNIFYDDHKIKKETKIIKTIWKLQINPSS